MKVYLVMDKNLWGIILKGIYTDEKDARKVQRRLGEAYLVQAIKRIAERDESYKNAVRNFERQGRKLERWSDLDHTPREWVNKFMVVIESFETDEPTDFILYME